MMTLAPKPIAALKVEAEGTDPLFALLGAHLEVENVVEGINVVLQPDGEIAVLPLPDFPQRHLLDFPDVQIVNSLSCSTQCDSINCSSS